MGTYVELGDEGVDAGWVIVTAHLLKE